MDNLIRISNGLPIVQIDYTTMTGTVTDTVGAELGGSQTDKDTDTVDIAKMVMSAVDEFARVFSYRATATRAAQLTVTAKPVTDAPGVYRAYLDFLKTPEHFKHEDTAPARSEAHIVRKYGKGYYYVPIAYRKEFFELALKTTVMRSDVVAAPESFSPTVTAAAVDRVVDSAARLRLALSSKIPNDIGTLKATIDEGVFLFQVVRRNDVPPDQPTDNITIVYSKSPQGVPIEPQVVAARLTGKKVEVVLAEHRPPVTSTDKLLEAIFTETQLNRLDSFRAP